MSLSATGAPPESTGERPPALVVSDVHKAFKLPHEQVHTLKERAMHPFRGSSFEQLEALSGVSFEVAEGEFFGVVGRNGSGKSTLLRCLSGIYAVDSGEITIAGRVSPFIELGVGFNPELTARDNVILNALMLGLTRRQAEDRFDDIIAFAELEEFLDLRLKNYSSGMQVRLGFSVAIQADAEVLLVDEVLAVGDAAFQQKCYEQFHRMKDEGRTVIFVTHDMTAVEHFCDRALLLERGKVADIGEPGRVARSYNEQNFGRTARAEDADDEAPADATPRAGRYEAEIVSAWFEDRIGQTVEQLAHGELLRIAFAVRFHSDQRDPIFSATLRNEAHQTVANIASVWRHGPTGDFAAGDEATVVFQVDNLLAPGRYTLTPSVARRGSGADVLDWRDDLASFVVHGTYVSGGLVDLPHEVEITVAERRQPA